MVLTQEAYGVRSDPEPRQPTLSRRWGLTADGRPGRPKQHADVLLPLGEVATNPKLEGTGQPTGKGAALISRTTSAEALRPDW